MKTGLEGRIVEPPDDWPSRYVIVHDYYGKVFIRRESDLEVVAPPKPKRVSRRRRIKP